MLKETSHSQSVMVINESYLARLQFSDKQNILTYHMYFYKSSNNEKHTLSLLLMCLGGWVSGKEQGWSQT